MQAQAELNVTSDMTVSIKINMTVREMDDLLAALEDVRKWPVSNLKSIISDVLRKARAHFDAEHELDHLR